MRIALLASFIAVFGAAGAAPHASFDCAKAATPVEKLVCADDALAALDVQMAAVFGKLIAANPGSAAAIRESQRSWLGERSQCIEGPQRTAHLSCLKDRYQNRLAVLQGNEFVACGKPKLTGKAFALTCTALNNPLGLSFVLAGQKADSDAALTKLSVMKMGSKPQDFKLEGQIFFDGLSTALELIDVNFDGFADIKVATATSAGPNMGYEYWLYEPKTGAFRATKLGDQLSGFEVMPDAKTKTIKVNGRSSCCSWNMTTYAWRGGVLVLRKSEDNGEFTPTDLPGLENTDQSLCGIETKSFDSAGLITRIDVVTGDPVTDYECSKEAIASENALLEKLKRAPKGYRIEPAKITGAFAIIFDKPKKPTN